MTLYVERSADEYGNRGCLKAVIDGDLVGDFIHVKAPQQFIAKWPTVSIDFFHEVSAGAGPARVIGGRPFEASQEMDSIIETYG